MSEAKECQSCGHKWMTKRNGKACPNCQRSIEGSTRYMILKARLDKAVEALEKIASGHYCRETGRYEDDARQALKLIKGDGECPIIAKK